MHIYKSTNRSQKKQTERGNKLGNKKQRILKFKSILKIKQKIRSQTKLGD